MSESKQLKCPSCGAVLSLDFPDQLVLECPFCHQQVVNTNAYKSTNNNIESRILEFRLKEKKVIEKLIEELANNQGVPSDIFDKMDIVSVERYYVPIYIFEGTFRAPWTAKSHRYEKRQRINYQGKLEDYYETLYDYVNGEAAGNFSVSSIPSDIASQLELRCDSVIVNTAQLAPLSKVQFKNSKDIKILSEFKDSNSVWRESGEGKAIGFGINYAERQAPERVTSCSASCELKNTSLVYIPLWKIKYFYNEELFNAIFYAEEHFDVDHPMNPSNFSIEEIEAQPTKEQKEILEKYNKRSGVIGKIQGFGCLSIALIGIVGCWGLDNYRHKHYLDPNYDYYKHADDAFNFLLNMFYVGIAFVVLFFIVDFLFDIKDGVGNIKEDIANRTRILQEEAENHMQKLDNYKRESAIVFLNNYIERQSDLNSNATISSRKNISTLHDANLPKTKTCVRCSKQINVQHKFCRYCGAKQD